MTASNEVQNALVLRVLQDRRSLTSLEAIQEFGILRLGARIYELRRAGHNIMTTRIPVEPKKSIGKYTLIITANGGKP